MTAPAVIPEEEWGLLANAVAEPVRGLIAVEAVDGAQMAEAERRLMDLAGSRPVLRQVAQPGKEAPETVWQRARQLTTPTRGTDTGPLPLLLVKVDAPPPADVQARQRLAEFWRGMNQLRENWHNLPAQVVFLLSPAAYEHLALNADHLKRWIGLKVRLWEGSTDLMVLERPGRITGAGSISSLTRPIAESIDTDKIIINIRKLAKAGPYKTSIDQELNKITNLAKQFRAPNAQLQGVVEMARQLQNLTLLAKQYKSSTANLQNMVEQTNKLNLLHRYLLPLTEGYLSIGVPEQAREWRKEITPDLLINIQDIEAVSKLDEQLEPLGRPAFDVFLSHNSRDKPAVRELANALRERGLIVWLDEDELRPGLNWQTQLENGIKLSGSVAVLIGKDGLGPWENEEIQGALIHAVRDGRPVIPVVLPDAPSQPNLPLFLGTRTWVDLRPTVNEDNLGRLIWGITGKKPNSEPAPAAPAPSLASPTATRACSPPAGKVASATATINPYDPWNPATPPRFFGRDKLLRRLGDALDQGRSVSLVGDWRIGKSSVLETWAEQARQRGRMVSLVSGEGAEAESCRAFVEKVTGRQDVFGTADSAADELSDWAEAATLPPLILVDEAERMLAHLPHRFFERLRGMLGRVCLVLASRRELGEISRDDHLTSPLLNRLELQRLGLLDDEGVNGILGLGAGVLDLEDGDLMREWAGRHPFYLTLLGHYLWDARRHGEGVGESLEEFQENAFQRLGELWQTLTAPQQNLLSHAVLSDHHEPDIILKRRGLLDDGYAFGHVLTEWLERRQ